MLTEGFAESPNSTALVFLGVLAAFCISLVIVVFVMYSNIKDKFVEKLATKLLHDIDKVADVVGKAQATLAASTATLAGSATGARRSGAGASRLTRPVDH